MSSSAPRIIFAALLLFASSAAAASSVQAAEADFLERFRGNWSGSGKVQREGTSQPRQVTCAVSGNPGENGIRAQGTCRAALIFNRPIGVDLTYDPRSGIYRGKYIGARIGPAGLIGKRSGNTMNLKIEWPHPVNGDTQASMVIQNDGQGMLRITVADNLVPGGPILTTSEIIMARR